MVCSSWNCTYLGDTSGSDTEMTLTKVSPMVQELCWRLMALAKKHHTSCVTDRPCCKHQNQGKTLLITKFNIILDANAIVPCGMAPGCPLEVAIPPRPHPEMLPIISWRLISSPPCGTSSSNHMVSLLIALNRRDQYCYCCVWNQICLFETNWNTDLARRGL